MKLKSSLSLLFLPLLSWSQSTHFNEVYPHIMNWGNMSGGVYNSESGYISLGFTSLGLVAREVDPNGVEIFSDITELPLPIQGCTPLSESNIEVNGNFVHLYGAVNSDQDRYPYVVMTDAMMDTVWTWYADWPIGQGDNFGPECLTQIDNGNLLTVSLARYGYFSGTDDPDSIGFRITELNLQGEVVQNHVQILDESEYCAEFSFSGVKQVNDFLVLWGYTYAQCSGADRQNFFMKTSLTGEILNVYYFGNPDNCMDWMGAAKITPNNTIVFTYPRCIDDSVDGNVFHQQQIVEFDPVFWQLISDESLDIAEWNVPISLGNNESMVQSPDGAFVTASYMYNVSGEYPIVTPRVFKAKTNGELDWFFEYTSGEETYDEALFDIENTDDGGFILTGMIELFPSFVQYHWMVKIDSCGYEQPGFCLPDNVGESEELEVKLWPNPTHRVLKAQLPLNSESVILSNAEGRVIFNEKVYHPHQQWRMDDLESGVYFFTVVLEDGRTIQQRVVKM